MYCESQVWSKKHFCIFIFLFSTKYNTIITHFPCVLTAPDIPMDTTDDVPMETDSSNGNGSGVSITGWTCAHCTFINKSPVSDVCDMCGLPKNWVIPISQLLVHFSLLKSVAYAAFDRLVTIDQFDLCFQIVKRVDFNGQFLRHGNIGKLPIILLVNIYASNKIEP